MQKAVYRPDIDGLRAVAIMPVIFFHIGFSAFPGGFVGVDVFFVISGFLITQLIRSEIETSSFSILGFYERRARRILPALFSIVFVTFVAGWLLFMPNEFRELGKRIVSTAIFSSNILLWNQADYFSGPVEMDPLVHTWSLAVEEQFYILFPLLMIAISKSKSRMYNTIIATIAVLSFISSVLILRVDRTAGFYLFPFRAWELLVGCLLALGALPPLRSVAVANGVAATGIATVLASTVLLTSDSTFPGFNALWPCLGTAAVIYGNTDHATLVRRMLGAKPIVAVGLISYSLYLIHWPLIVFVKYQILRDLTTIEKLMLIVLMLVLASLSWRYIEAPFRNKRWMSRRTILTGSAAGIGVWIACGLFIFVFGGIPQRFPRLEALASPDPVKSTSGPTCFLRGHYRERWSGSDCYLSHGDGPTTLLWGDSHANQYRDVLSQGTPPMVPNLLLYATGGCVPILDVDVVGRSACRANNDFALSIIRDFHVKTVILSGNWDYTIKSSGIPMDAFEKTIEKLRSLNVDVKVIGDNPFYPFANPKYLGYRLSQRQDPEAAFYLKPANDRSINARLKQMTGANQFFDPMLVLCKKAECLVYDKGKLVNEDTGHLSPYGRTLVAQELRSFLTQ